MAERKGVLLRLDPAVHDALTRWANDELRSTNAQIEFLLRRALAESGRLPSGAAAPPRRGRPRKDARPRDDPPGEGSGEPPGE
ncbi:hypothetical protein [Saccharothrix algeriensis]|uniref:Arc-like DNA binding domain-containing protein n=1 Tax=Saccharothrix algeriensis TaxID=173560 RepID=A0ABS2S5G7_9PSEU|nr:hypothetical protein [Saccharothrix algeriensis]MBM7810944.1 hypothetical protein [Saccharothrix algeriensis]